MSTLRDTIGIIFVNSDGKLVTVSAHARKRADSESKPDFFHIGR